jgi:hypothetical protein
VATTALHLLSRDPTGWCVVVEGTDLVGVVALVLDLKPCTWPSVRRELLDHVTNGLSSVEKSAIAKPATPLSCEQHGGRRVVEVRHIASPFFRAGIVAETRERVTKLRG